MEAPKLIPAIMEYPNLFPNVACRTSSQYPFGDFKLFQTHGKVPNDID